MADEPRRSGRATKGQHKNLEPAEVSTPKSKKAATVSSSKKSKKSAEPEPEPEDDGEGEEEVIRCVCGDTTDEIEGRAFVSCDACSVWQHNVCMGLPIEDEKLPDHYLCEQCQPDDHKPLLDAMARGEQPWEDRKRAHEEHLRQERNRKKAGKRKSKGGASKSCRASDVKSEAPPSEPSPAPVSAPAAAPAPAPAPAPVVAPTPTPAPAPPAPEVAPVASTVELQEPAPTNNKRKHSEEQQPAEERRRSSASNKKRKSEQQKEEKVDVDTALVDIDQLPKERQNVAKRLATVLADGVRDKVTTGSYSLGAGENAESVSRQYASRIEYELYQVHGAPTAGAAYATQFRAIDANLKKNHMLIQRLLDGSLTPHGLATMSTQDMASEELQKQRQQLKEEADKQAVMIRDEDEDKPRVRRTHKGDEYIDDEQDNNTHESVFTSQPVRIREDQEKPPTPPNAESTAVSGAAASPDGMDIDADAARRQSQQQQFDINSVWAKTHDPDQPPAQPTRRRSSFNKTPQEKGEKHDADVDRLLADDNDTDYAPPEADGVVWKGPLIQPGVTEFVACARHVAGADFARYMDWTEFLPPTFEIEGRLEAKRADDYLCGLQWSKKSDVSVLAITPYDDASAFDQVYEYFATRGRYAVIRKGHGMSHIVKDVYITPVGPGNRLPPHLDLLEYNTLDPAVPDRKLVMTFVVNKPAHWDHPSVNDQPAVAQSPVNGHNPSGPQYSPRPPQGFTPMQNGHYPPSMPPNPYTSTPSAPPNYPLAGGPAQAYPSPVPQQAQPFPPHPNPMVNSILGPLAQSPVVAQILSAAGNNVEEHVLLNMRDILQADPSAREDLGIFQQRLAVMGSGSHQPQQPR